MSKIYTMHDVQQSSDEWFSLKAGVASTSNFDSILAKGRGGNEAVTRKAYRIRLAIERITGRYIQSEFKSYDMQRGNEQEEVAALAYTLGQDRSVKEVGFAKLNHLEAGASFDRIASDSFSNEWPLEIKNPRLHNHIEYVMAGELPSKYKPQVQGQLWIGEYQYSDFMSYNGDAPAGLDRLILRVERDEDYIQMLAGEVEQFLTEVDETVDKLKGMM